MAAYLAGAVIALVVPWAAIAIYIAVAAMWFMPDRRVEKAVERDGDTKPGP